MISSGVRKAASPAASGLRHTRGLWTYLPRPQCETEKRAVCPRSLLRPAGLWSTNGGMRGAFEHAMLRERTKTGLALEVSKKLVSRALLPIIAAIPGRSSRAAFRTPASARFQKPSTWYRRTLWRRSAGKKINFFLPELFGRIFRGSLGISPPDCLWEKWNWRS